MRTLIGAAVAAVVAALFAVGTTVGVVSAVSNDTPEPVNQPLVVYGTR